MRILFVLKNDTLEGSALSAITLIEGLIKHGHNVVVAISESASIELLNMFLAKDISCYTLPITFFAYPNITVTKTGIVLIIKNYIKLLFCHIVATFKLCEIIKQHNIEIVHSNVGVIACGFFAAKLKRVKHVWHIREYGDRDFNIKVFPNRKFFIKMFRHSSVICITKQLLTYNHLENYENAHVVYNGVQSMHSAKIQPKKGKYFLCASRISQEKGFSDVLMAFKSFAEKNSEYQLFIIGSGSEDYVNTLQKYCIDNKLTERVIFKGFQPDVADYMLNAKALIVASYSEGFGRMTAEAAFNGCLVIGRNTAGTKEIMDITGGNRFLSTEELVSCMNKVVNLTDDEYNDKAKYAMNKAIEEFSQEKYISEILSIYSNL